MRRHYSLRRSEIVSGFGALLMLLLLAGCIEVRCPNCCGKDGDGLCNNLPTTGNYTGPASPNFYDTATGALYTGGGNCSGGKMCASSPGRCSDGTACRSWVRTSDMFCKCDCKAN